MTFNVQRLKEILATALEISGPADRMDYVRRACGVDHNLREELNRLLGAHGSIGDFLETPAVSPNVKDAIAGRVTGASGGNGQAGADPVSLGGSRSDVPNRGRLRQIFWPAVYTYFRARRCEQERAAALTSVFLGQSSLAKQWVTSSSKCFRSFLLVELEGFYRANREQTSKPGSGDVSPLVAADQIAAEDRYFSAELPSLGADALFSRRWALLVLELALGRLEEAERAAGRGFEYANLQNLLAGPQAGPGAGPVSSELGLTAEAAGQAAPRLRDQFHETLRIVVRDTVIGPVHVDEELNCLLAAIREG